MSRAPARPVRIAMTLGDPRGIGPEVVEAAARRRLERDSDTDLVLVGPDGFAPDGLPYRAVGPWDGSEAGAGEVSAEAIRTAVRACLSGECVGLVTGPIHKGAFAAAGIGYPGHTELLQALAGADRVGMLMAAERTHLGPPLRVLLATIHIALRDVPSALTSRRLVDQVMLLAESLRSGWDVSRPRIALCALNPHASDGGLFGDEEERIYAPAVRELRELEIDVSEPVPADTVFTRTLRGEFDAVVAPYHDVGMAAFKTASFGQGVNVTLGLPFIRTSPDHGTAFDIAGTGKADATSTVQAMELAFTLAHT